MVSTNNFKTGMTILLDGKLQQIVEFQHVKPGKGGAFVRSKLKNVETGKVVDHTFRAGIDVEQAIVERRDLQFLYREGDDFVLMDAETYDQQNASSAAMGDAVNYLKEGDTVQVSFFDGRIVGVDLPASVALEITHTEPGVAGNTATNATKPATLETGLELQVPLFIEIGETIKVDTRSGAYMSRA
ncbi:elongation factor P [Nitriliruptoraceae bacterium ZYF776]|nr:elongation factor P [Profundirhabdus halotolerans]